MISPPESSTKSPGHQPAFVRRLPFLAAIVIFIVGALIRLLADFAYKNNGYDEAVYRDYLLMVDKVGVAEYPNICELYLIKQRNPGTQATLPPTRFLYIFCGWMVKQVAFGDAPPADLKQPDAAYRDPAFISMRQVSLVFAIVTVGLCGLAAWRMMGPGVGLGTMALVASSPLGIYMGKHAFVDGFFGFWATLCLWLLWENLQRPGRRWWIVSFAISLALMVMAKENALFVYIALAGLVAINPWMKFGTVTRPLLAAGVIGPSLGVCVLLVLTGGVGPFIEIFKLFITKANTLDFVISYGDGPWYRYLLELIIMEPLVAVLALTALFTLPRKSPVFAYLLIFVLVSYVIMCNLRYGMNVRFTTIWALPLAAFAAAQVISLTANWGRYATPAAILFLALMAASNWQQYQVYFVKNAIYEPLPPDTLKAIKILKPAPSSAGP